MDSRNGKRARNSFSPFAKRRKQQRMRRDWPKIVALMASIVGGTTVLFALVGFGVALSADIDFGMPYASLFSSTSELVALTAVAIARYFDEVASWASVGELFMSGLRVGAPFALALFVLWMVVFLFQKSISSVVRRWKERVSHLIAAREGEPGKVRLLAEALFLSLLTLLIQPLAAVGWFLITLLLLTLISVPPLVGVAAGQSYIKKYVTSPKHCAGRSVAASQDLATCLTIRTKDFGTLSGRLVYATSSVVVLYDPSVPGLAKVIRVPIAEAVIELSKDVQFAPKR